MGATWNETPSANRLHIGVFGKTNSGKSSFINAFSGQKVSIVADVPGTTTDPVYKAMEIYPLGPCVLIDTAGFDDEGELGALRIEKTELAAQKTDLAIILFCEEEREVTQEEYSLKGKIKCINSKCYFRSLRTLIFYRFILLKSIYKSS